MVITPLPGIIVRPRATSFSATFCFHIVHVKGSVGFLSYFLAKYHLANPNLAPHKYKGVSLYVQK
jgi:hypothetical protein